MKIKEKRKEQKGRIMEVDQKIKVTKQKECHLVPETQPNLNETVLELFFLVTGLEVLLELIVEQSNLYAHQNGRNFKLPRGRTERISWKKLRYGNQKVTHDC